MATLRRIIFAVFVLLFMLLAAVFAYNNPQPIDVDIGLVRLEQVPMSIAFAGVFAFGWLFGLISAGLALLRSSGEKRRLRKELKYAESELSTLRALPPQDAH